ncbi:MAG: cobalt ECF transporter T component CbiQ [Planctomycetota bacterium]|nr:cobalt ECF transporter T component CbiQ [Planctomycetota bacterium]
MEHDFLDRYSERDSFLHWLDPRTKIITFCGLIIVVVLTPTDNPPEAGLGSLHRVASGDLTVWYKYFLVVFGLAILSRVPLWFILKRSTLIIPFALMIGIFIPFFKEGQTAFIINLGFTNLRVTAEGLAILRNILLKSWFSVTILTLLIATTNFTAMLKGMERLKAPRVMITILSFMYRYLFVIIDEMERMVRARNNRFTLSKANVYFGGQFLRQLKVIGNMIGILFIRSYERAERVYLAMLGRGFDGSIRTIKQSRLRWQDVGFVMAITIVLVLILI